MATAQSEWALGLADEVWWSGLAQPPLPAWAAGQPVRLQQRTRPKDDPDPQTRACYGILRTDPQEGLVRFVAGRPVSQGTTAFLRGVGARLNAEAKKALLVGWDNASWHRRQEGRDWIQAHNRPAKPSGSVRIVVCQRPIKSPWLNRLEPHWSHAKRAVAEPRCRLSNAELISRICAYFHCQYVEPLQQLIAKKVA